MLGFCPTCSPQAFAAKHYQPRLYEYPKFDSTFRRLLADAEAQSDAARRPTLQQNGGTANGHTHQVGRKGALARFKAQTPTMKDC